MRKITSLAHADAMMILEAIRQRADTSSAGLACAIVDPYGELLAFLRTDGCRLPSVYIAQNKAYTAAREGIQSAELGRRSREEGFPMTNFGELRYVTWGGGVPIYVEDVVVGAVGVSGLSEAEDIDYAQYGIQSWLNSLG